MSSSSVHQRRQPQTGVFRGRRGGGQRSTGKEVPRGSEKSPVVLRSFLLLRQILGRYQSANVVKLLGYSCDEVRQGFVRLLCAKRRAELTLVTEVCLPLARRCEPRPPTAWFMSLWPGAWILAWRKAPSNRCLGTTALPLQCRPPPGLHICTRCDAFHFCSCPSSSLLIFLWKSVAVNLPLLQALSLRRSTFFPASKILSVLLPLRNLQGSRFPLAHMDVKTANVLLRGATLSRGLVFGNAQQSRFLPLNPEASLSPVTLQRRGQSRRPRLLQRKRRAVPNRKDRRRWPCPAAEQCGRHHHVRDSAEECAALRDARGSQGRRCGSTSLWDGLYGTGLPVQRQRYGVHTQVLTPAAFLAPASRLRDIPLSRRSGSEGGLSCTPGARTATSILSTSKQ